MRKSVRTLLQLLVLCLLTISNNANADKCRGQTAFKAKNKCFKVGAEYNNGKMNWTYFIKERKTGKVKKGTIPHIESHAHLFFYLSKRSKRFMIIDLNAGHRLNNRVLIFDMQGNLIVSLGVSDILNEKEVENIVHTVSHIQWVINRFGVAGPGKYDSNTDSICIHSYAERNICIRMQDGKVIGDKMDDSKEKSVEK